MDNNDKRLEDQRELDPEPMETINTVSDTTESHPPGGVIHNHYHYEQTPSQIPSEQAVRSRNSQGRVWLVLAIIAIIIVCIGFYSLTGQTAKISNSVQDQTSAIREQTGVLGSIRDNLSSIAQSIREAIIRFFN
jgi:uncharacterized protein HemX